MKLPATKSAGPMEGAYSADSYMLSIIGGMKSGMTAFSAW
jgi:hypothetical protein